MAAGRGRIDVGAQPQQGLDGTQLTAAGGDSQRCGTGIARMAVTLRHHRRGLVEVQIGGEQLQHAHAAPGRRMMDDAHPVGGCSIQIGPGFPQNGQDCGRVSLGGDVGRGLTFDVGEGDIGVGRNQRLDHGCIVSHGRSHQRRQAEHARLVGIRSGVEEASSQVQVPAGCGVGERAALRSRSPQPDHTAGDDDDDGEAENGDERSADSVEEREVTGHAESW